MRVELKWSLLLSALSIVISRFVAYQNPISDFFCGLFVALGLFFLAVNLLPENTYNNLLYRKWVARRNG